MGRIGISEYQVFQAADQLLADGARPSVDAIRLELGNTGSRTTINKYLKAWRERCAHREAAGANLSGHLRQIITEQAELLLTAIEAEAEAKLQAKSQQFETLLQAHEDTNKELECALSQSLSQLAAQQEVCENQKLQLLRQQSDLADMRERNQSYHAALAKEVGRREMLERAIVERDHQLNRAQKELKGIQDRNEIVTESYATKVAELQSLQQRDRDQRALLKEKASETKELKIQLKALRAQYDKDIGRLSRSLTELARSSNTRSAPKRKKI